MSYSRGEICRVQERYECFVFIRKHHCLKWVLRRRSSIRQTGIMSVKNPSDVQIEESC